MLVLPGDAPLLTPHTLAGLLAEHAAARAAATMLTSVVADPTGYGRVIRSAESAERVSRVVEHRDASPAELRWPRCPRWCTPSTPDCCGTRSTGCPPTTLRAEEYLPEVVSILVAEGREVLATLAPA